MRPSHSLKAGAARFSNLQQAKTGRRGDFARPRRRNYLCFPSASEASLIRRQQNNREYNREPICANRETICVNREATEGRNRGGAATRKAPPPCAQRLARGAATLLLRRNIYFNACARA